MAVSHLFPYPKPLTPNHTNKSAYGPPWDPYGPMAPYGAHGPMEPGRAQAGRSAVFLDKCPYSETHEMR